MPTDGPGIGPGSPPPDPSRLIDVIVQAGAEVPPPVRQHLYPLPLNEVLDIFTAAAPRVKRHPVYWRYGRDVIGVPEPELNAWYSEAWWGTCAAGACENRLAMQEREQEVLDLVDPVDWSPLNTLLARRKGVLLCGSHWGVPYVLQALLAGAGRPALQVGDWHKRHQLPGTDLSHAGEPAALTRLYLQAFLRLREGGIAQIVPDGWHWRVGTDERFLGLPCRVSLAPAALARLTGAPALPYMALWEGGRIRVSFAPAIEPEPGEAEAADRRWIRRYLDWLEHQVRSYPRAVRLNFLYPRVALPGATPAWSPHVAR